MNMYKQNFVSWIAIIQGKSIEQKTNLFHSVQIVYIKRIRKMPDIAWDILKQTDLKVAWRLAVKDMSKEFFSSQMVVVPHIEEASFYDLMVCFTKEKIGVLEKLAKVGPEYQLRTW